MPSRDALAGAMFGWSGTGAGRVTHVHQSSRAGRQTSRAAHQGRSGFSQRSVRSRELLLLCWWKLWLLLGSFSHQIYAAAHGRQDDEHCLSGARPRVGLEHFYKRPSCSDGNGRHSFVGARRHWRCLCHTPARVWPNVQCCWTADPSFSMSYQPSELMRLSRRGGASWRRALPMCKARALA